MDLVLTMIIFLGRPKSASFDQESTMNHSSDSDQHSLSNLMMEISSLEERERIQEMDNQQTKKANQ